MSRARGPARPRAQASSVENVPPPACAVTTEALDGRAAQRRDPLGHPPQPPAAFIDQKRMCNRAYTAWS